MTEDTKRALDAIRPMAKALKMSVSADERFLYVNDTAIGISCNSTYATIMEFIGYMTEVYDSRFRDIELTATRKRNIERYWFTKDQVAKLGGYEHGLKDAEKGAEK